MNSRFVPKLNEVGVTFFFEYLSHRIPSDGAWHMDRRLIVKYYEDTPYLLPSYLACFREEGVHSSSYSMDIEFFSPG